MNDQKSKQKTPSRIHRAVRPRSPASARARAVRYFGSRRCERDGSGSSCIEHLDELARRVFAGELEEDVLEPRRTRFGVRTQLFHRAAGPDLSRLDDRDAVAER